MQAQRMHHKHQHPSAAAAGFMLLQTTFLTACPQVLNVRLKQGKISSAALGDLSGHGYTMPIC
eukprot:scaffold64173_cov16-Tisochrysis_lutea.AAC.1